MKQAILRQCACVCLIRDEVMSFLIDSIACIIGLIHSMNPVSMGSSFQIDYACAT